MTGKPTGFGLEPLKIEGAIDPDAAKHNARVDQLREEQTRTDRLLYQAFGLQPSEVDDLLRKVFVGKPIEEEIVEAALAWAAARQAVLQEEIPDVRTSQSFRERLEALATAEQRLVAATTRKE